MTLLGETVQKGAEIAKDGGIERGPCLQPVGGNRHRRDDFVNRFVLLLKYTGAFRCRQSKSPNDVRWYAFHLHAPASLPGNFLKPPHCCVPYHASCRAA